jgi:hypothetical protein
MQRVSLANLLMRRKQEWSQLVVSSLGLSQNFKINHPRPNLTSASKALFLPRSKAGTSWLKSTDQNVCITLEKFEQKHSSDQSNCQVQTFRPG